MKNLKTYQEFKNRFEFEKMLNETRNTYEFYHGSTDKKLEGKNGIHIGSKKAATQALEARIGTPAKGEWDGKRKYKDTLLAGQKRLKEITKERGCFVDTGFNCGSNVPEEDYYVEDRKDRATYSNGTQIPLDCKPVVFGVKIVGTMNNTQDNPKTDDQANMLIIRSLRKGNAKNGYFYENIGEDEGSISAVVPDKSFLQII